MKGWQEEMVRRGPKKHAHLLFNSTLDFVNNFMFLFLFNKYSKRDNALSELVRNNKEGNCKSAVLNPIM